MPCEQYKAALAEAAASGSELQETLRAHLAGCERCRASFGEEQRLFAAIDNSLRATANAEAPVSLLPRVRARLEEHVVPERNWVPAWMIIAATAALIVLTIAYQNKRRDAVSSYPQKSIVSQNVSPAVVPAAQTDAPSGTDSQQGHSKRSRLATLDVSASVQQVSVLLPAGQKESLDGLLTSLQRGQVKGEVLLKQDRNLLLEDLRIFPLDVASIQVKPLTDESGASPSGSTDSKL